MKIIGILSWYDEQAAWLAACVSSMAHAGLSHIVAIDGAYALYPESTRYPRSGTEQHAVITETCQALGVGSTIVSPSDPWFGNECEKRSFGFQVAELYADPGDWYFIMDADQVITSSLGLRDTLEETDCDVAEALFYERGIGEQMNGQRALWPVRCIFRALPDLRVVGKHYSYVTPDGRDLWGEPPYEPACSTTVEIEHRTRWRPAIRKQAQDAYYQRRDELGVERGVLHG